MAHYSRVFKAVIDVSEADHDKELSFWRQATGWALPEFKRQPEYHGSPSKGGEFALLLQRLGDGESRVHLDIHTDDLDAEVARLESLGARRVEKIRFWWVMQDPAGLPFCVLPQEPGTLTDANAQRWD